MAPSPADAPIERLRTAEVEVVGRFAAASNATLLVRLRAADGSWPELPLDPDGNLEFGSVADGEFAVYKPRAGEAPLWDFPPGTLWRRELAAYEVDRMLGWDLVPPTVSRPDAPHGPGALQWFVPHDPAEHYFALVERDEPALVSQLQRMVLFDLVVDNADRKAGHVLLDRHGRIRLVDHGVSFNVEDKLRTVAWDWAGQLLPEAPRDDVGAFADRLAGDGGAESLCDLLAPEEIDRLVDRARRVAAMSRFPEPTGRRPYPWPLV